jgi:hypothetical protein
MFTQDTFAPISAHATTSPKVYSYQTDDDIDTVLGAGYFDEKKFQLETGDWIFCSVSSGNRMLQVSSNTGAVETTDVSLERQIIVRSASDFNNTRSDVVYFVDGVVDMGSTSIDVPAGGLFLTGHNFVVSKLISSEENYTMFTSPVGGSGDFIGAEYAIEVTGVGSQVYDLTSATNFDAFEFSRINYNNCTSLGEITNYRQGLEIGTGRFGGHPTLTLGGSWAGGYRITTSIVRIMPVSFTGALFEAGSGFTMQSRFLTDINADLGTNGSLFDFAAANFPNPSTIQVDRAIISRNGVSNAEDANITPNITASELACAWSDNVGIDNTYEGGKLTISVELATVITSPSTYFDLAGTWTASELQHFDSPANGEIRHLGSTPRDYQLYCDLVVDSTANNVLDIKFVKWDDSTSQFEDVGSQVRQVNNIVGGRDVAFFNVLETVTLDKNDYVKLQVANLTASNNVTLELDSYLRVGER